LNDPPVMPKFQMAKLKVQINYKCQKRT